MEMDVVLKPTEDEPDGRERTLTVPKQLSASAKSEAMAELQSIDVKTGNDGQVMDISGNAVEDYNAFSLRLVQYGLKFEEDVAPSDLTAESQQKILEHYNKQIEMAAKAERDTGE